MSDTADETDEIEIEVERRDRSTNQRRDRSRRSAGVTGETDEETPPQRLEDELGRVDVRTTAEGYVEGRVTDIESVDESTVRLEVTLPHDEVATFTLEKPIPWSEEFLLARIVEDVGYGANSISHLVGERIYLTRADLEPDAADRGDGSWWSDPVRSAGDALLASVGSRFRLEMDRAPEWRLVDPRERRSDAHGESNVGAELAVGTLLVLLGPVVAAVGVASATSGGLAVSGALVGSVLAGIVLALIGAAALIETETNES
ncbi:hypothetical protein ACLI4Z_03445 [Natrialbaceae archaeon A-arb3/5]